MLISVLHLPLIINDHNKAREGREPLFRDLLTPTSGSKFNININADKSNVNENIKEERDLTGC